MPQNELLESFIQEAEEVMAGLESGVARLQTYPAQSQQEQDEMAALSILAHRMKGTSGLYGYAQISTLSGLMERLFDARPSLSGAHHEQFLSLLGTINSVLSDGIKQLRQGGSDRDLGLTFSRIGGSATLQQLVEAVPEQFQMRARHHLPQQQDIEEAPTEAELPQGVEGELQQFTRENGEVWEYFAPEVQEHIASLRDELQKGDAADLNVMFRSAHTIKGSSFMVGLPALGNFAHRMEDLLGALREDAVQSTPEVVATLNRSVDLMDDMTRVAEGAEIALQERMTMNDAALRAMATGQQVAAISTPAEQIPAATAAVTAPLNTTIRVSSEQLEALMEQVGEVVTARARMTRMLERLDDLQNGMQASQQRFQRTVRDFEERYLNPDMVRFGQDEQNQNMGTLNLTDQFAELEFDSYNDLNILSRSITELSADFAEVRRNLSEAITELNDENERLGKLVRQLRVDVTQTSRVPFAQAATRLQRWAREQPVTFDFNVSGEDVLIESSMIQRIVDPLLHLLTNAVYHGLSGEGNSPAERVAAGKPEHGQVWLSATPHQNYIDITVADDGRGIDLSRVREKTLERGLRSAQELDQMADEDVARLILLPGLSTAQEVGSVTGRGVGMDVVATTIRQLGGELLIQSERGVGTAFTLRIPTTQRIMDILQVQLGDESQVAAFPVNSVRALRDVPQNSIHAGTEGLMVDFEGQQVPLIDARQIWGFEGFDAVNANEAGRVVFLNTITGPVAVRVREFGRIEEVSVAPPSPMLSTLEYMGGTAISTAGEALVLLEPTGLLRLARRPDSWLAAGSTNELGLGQKRRVLLVDDSLSVRRLVGRMLERGGLTVVTANDGQEALDTLQLDSDFDAVITDLEMPRMNGYELLSAVRARPDSAELPVLVMTTRAGEKHQRLAFQMGANDYFTKPVNEALLLRRLNTLLSGQGLLAAPAMGSQGQGMQA